jgi:2-hydroxychromene-2-carboxylate isomerase
MKKHHVARFYFAFRSPYSWIASRLLEERWPDTLGQLELVPFWEPDAHTLELLHHLGGDSPYIPMSKAKHLYILQDVKRLTARLGYQMAWPIDKDPWWDLPHLAYLVARKQGRGRAFLRAAYRARWEDGADICTAAAIRRLAVEVGLEADELAEAPQIPEIRAEGAQALYRADRENVFGVPFFTYGYKKFWGVDRLEDFVACLAPEFTLGLETNDEPGLTGVPQAIVDNVGCYDTDCEGGCG